jgi:hypothetical protein
MSLTSIFQDIADAIRSKTGKSESIYPVDMASEIEGIESGGSDGIITRNIRSGARIGSSLSLVIDVYESEV